MKNEYYTLLDKRDKSFKLYATVEEIANELLIFNVLDIYEIDEILKRYNNGQDGYYIYELNREGGVNMAFVEIMGLVILVFVIYVLIVVIQDKFNDKGG